ncbi:LysR family transcriptional regulator [Litoribrevibacter albus]|uniref:LysR family transcriptional regulator n=1 Tax=Litoribrevibacter albus TaxID=1473156 RepID=A0AA37W894_9GAMM|nr:LysR family transcriptional regulator [Litoribrevibacter albus]GLQ33595.1 LysR family transcriptional regulator [Litoribrevibacter albus]
MKLPPLNALPAFEAVARLNSFTKAADELNVSQSAISHQIRALESYLGEDLFTRQGRKLSLTEEGQNYWEAISSSLSQIERASEQLQGVASSEIRLALFSSFAVRWLIPNLPSLQRNHPEVDLQLEMKNDNPVLSDHTADCFVTIQPESKGYSMDLLYIEKLFPICSRSYWNQMCDTLYQQGKIDTLTPAHLPAELLFQFPLLSTISIFDKPKQDWQRWAYAGRLSIPDTVRYQQFSHMLLTLEAARHHQGIALTNDYMYDPDRDSDLIRLPCHDFITDDKFYFAFKTSRRNEPSIMKVRQWIQKTARSTGLI